MTSESQKDANKRYRDKNHKADIILSLEEYELKQRLGVSYKTIYKTGEKVWKKRKGIK